MSIDGGGEDLRSDINVTPLVDVMLVLLVIFMVVTPLLHQELQIELPVARTSTDVTEPAHLHLTAAADGSLRLNDEPLTREQLPQALAAAYANRTDRTIFLQADRSLPYAAVVDLMDACREAGVERIGVITRKQADENDAHGHRP
jgi:biopolymer transport protein ExbD